MSAGHGQAAVPRELVDLERLAEWMDGQGLGHGPLEDVTSLGGGTQNILLRFTRDGHDYVLRRPPEHKRRNSDETMRREARVLEALRDTEVPHPGFVAGCPHTDVIGAAFTLMRHVEGFNPTVEVPEPYRRDPALHRDLGLAMVDGLLALARVEPTAVGIGDLGRPDGWLERQVSRWRRQLDGYRDLDVRAGTRLPHVEETGRWLQEHRPATSRTGLIHGDYHLANVLARRDVGALAAVVDWELATQGDPLLDLGHLLATWPSPGDPAQVTPVDLPGLPRGEELVEHYAARSDRDLGDIAWFRVLACYRLGILLEGTHARALAGLAPPETGRRLHVQAVSLLEQARRLIG